MALVRLIEPKRFSSLSKVCGTVAWVRRAANFWLNKIHRAPESAKWEARGSKLSVEERALAFQDLAFAAQEGVDLQDTTLNRLVVAKDVNTGLLLCGGRVQSWNRDSCSYNSFPVMAGDLAG